MPFGLMNSETFEAERWKNPRRMVFYNYPHGAATLTEILSLAKEEMCNDPEFTWYEKRMPEQVSATAAISSTVVLYSTVSADFQTWTTASGNVAIEAATTSSQHQYGVKVADDSQFRVNHIIRFVVVEASSGNNREIVGRVTYVDRDNDRLAFHAIRGTGANDADYDAAGGVGVQVQVIGSSYTEGASTSTPGLYELPTRLNNYCQIFRTPFEITGTGLHTSAKFDKTGIYKDMAKQYALNHLVELEKGMIFGRRGEILDSSGRPLRHMGGIIEQLELWEAGSTYGNVAATDNDDDNKRIIDINDSSTDLVSSAGQINDTIYSTLLERIFRSGTSGANEKLVLCGSGYLQVVNELYKNSTTLNANLPAGETWGFKFVEHVTPFGSIFYKTHPLFSQNAELRNSALILDVGNLVYRYLDGRDTQLLKNRQNPGDDFRRDEWLSECSLEVRMPESHMFVKNVLTAAS